MIKRIEFSGINGISGLRVDFTRAGLSWLYGAPASGKTTLFAVLQILQKISRGMTMAQQVFAMLPQMVDITGHAKIAIGLADLLSDFQRACPQSYSVIVDRLKDGIFPDLVGYEFAKANEDAPRRLTFIFEKDGAGLIRSRFGTSSDGEKCAIVRMMVSALRSDMKKANGQYFFSSHSLQALDAVPVEKIKVFMRDSHLEPTYLRDVKDLVADPKQLEFLDLKLLSGSLYNEA